MTNMLSNNNLRTDTSKIGQVDEYKYLGHEIKISQDNLTCGIYRQIGLG